MLLLSVLASMKVTELNKMLKYLVKGSDYVLSLQGQTCPGPEIVLAPARTVAFCVGTLTRTAYGHTHLQHAIVQSKWVQNAGPT
jgi:hypothetical protein